MDATQWGCGNQITHITEEIEIDKSVQCSVNEQQFNHQVYSKGLSDMCLRREIYEYWL